MNLSTSFGVLFLLLVMRKSKESFELKYLREKIYRRYTSELNEIQHVIFLKSIDKKFIESIKPVEIIDGNYWKDCVYYFVHTIITKTLNEDFKSSRSSFVALNFAELKTVLGGDVSKVIITLETNGIIKKDYKYKKGTESYGYKITTKYFKNNTIEHKTITSHLIKKRLVKYRTDFFEKQKPLISKNAHLVKWFFEDRLEYNTHESNFFIKILKDTLLLIVKYLKLNSTDKKKIISKIEWLDYYKDFSIKGDLPVFSIHGERLYSEITSMYSPLRNFLSYKGKKLIYFDISNSQPFHFCLLLKPYFWQEKNKQGELTLRNQNRELYEWIVKNKKEELDNTIMNLKEIDVSGKTLIKKGIRRNKNVSPHYTHLSANGKLYLFIHEHFKGKFVNNQGVDPFVDLISSKQEFIKMLYYDDKNKHSPTNKYFIEFKKHFKIESSIIQLLKKRRYNDFSILLQKVESTILLQNVCRAIYNEYPDMPLYTIHDGILTTESNAAILEEKIEQVYSGVFGFSPDLKREILSPRITMMDFLKIVKKKMNKMLEDLNIRDFNFSPEIEFQINLMYIKNLKIEETTSIEL